MSASVPWSVNAVEPESWATARDAARRSGLSVGEWLDGAIREQAGEGGRPRGREHARNSSDPIEQKLDDLADRLDHLVRHEREPSAGHDRGGRNDAALIASIEGLSDRIESLMRDVRTADRNGPAEVRSAIQRLDDRIEELISRGRLSSAGATPELERKLSAIENTIETMSRRLENENARFSSYPVPPTVHELDAAVAEIMVRQSALDGVPLRDYERRVAAKSDLTGLERQLKIMADEMHALRRSGVQAETVEALRREIADLAGKLADLAPRRALEALEGTVEALVRRIDRGAGTRPDETISEVVEALHDIRSALADVRPAESFASVEKDLHALSTKLDALSTRGLDADTLARLHAQTVEIRDLISSALPSDALTALVEQIEVLVGRFEGTTAPTNNAVLDVVTALDRRIQSLSERIETTARQLPAAPAIDEIRARLDQLQHAIGGVQQTSSTGLESTLRTLAEKLDASESRVANLGGIERGLKDLFTQMQEARAGAIEVAERAAKSALREMAASETAKPTADRGRANGELETRYAGGPSPAPLRPEPHSLTGAGRTAQDRDLAGDLVADFPLEPGSGAPNLRLMQSAAQRVAQSEAALGGIAPKAAGGPSRTSDFIAAARRAAQSAAAETPAELAKGRDKAGRKGTSTVIMRGKRALLIALAAFLLVFTALRFFDGFLPAWLPSIPTRSSIETPKPSLPKAPEPAARNRSSVPDTGAAAIANAPPAGIIGPDANANFLGEKASEDEPTGSIATTRTAGGIAKSIAALVEPEPVAASGQELPAGIGTAALRMAAMGGDSAAAHEIGSRYAEGRGVQANAAEAVRWFDRAFAKGSKAAAFRLGISYEKGHGVAKNHAEARRYYLIAAEGGHVKAMHNLAVLEAESGEGKPVYPTALRWFRMAADRGVSDSQYNLGVLYARGLGIEQNLAESFRWFSLAAAQGDADAKKKRDDVANRLDVQTLLAARLAVQTWQALPVDEAVNTPRLKPEWEKGEPTSPRKRAVRN